jgi:hypothetical protein
MAHFHAIEAQEGIAKALHRVAGGIESQKALPDHPTAPGSKDTEEKV